MPTNSPDIANIISQKLGISFLLNLDPEMVPRGNVCFAQSPELRPEYRETFTLEDLIGYLFGIVNSRIKKEVDPADAKMFWEMVKIGNELQRDSKIKYVAGRSTIEIQPVLKHNWVTHINLDDTEKIWINDSQFLVGIPPQAWELRLEGEYPAKQWLENCLYKEMGAKEMLEFQGLIEHLNKVRILLNEIENPN